MYIKSLLIDSRNPDAQLQFYTQILGFNRVEETSMPGVEIGESTLAFRARLNHPAYHFAFQIKTGHLEQTIDYLQSLNIPILLNKGEPITYFENGRSIYFYDAYNNIAEFIERPLVAPKAIADFNPLEVVRINEIGCPVANPSEFAAELMKSTDINPIAQDSFTDVFCWVGDHNGVVIVTKQGRPWLPTDTKGAPISFELEYGLDSTSWSTLSIGEGRMV